MMRANIQEQLFSDSYYMINLEITFDGVRKWFDMAGISIPDKTLFKTLLFPEQSLSDDTLQILQMIIYRYEDVFFQANKEYTNVDEPDTATLAGGNVHRLLVDLMKVKTLRGSEEALLDLYVELDKDKLRVDPAYPSLHDYFDNHYVQ